MKLTVAILLLSSLGFTFSASVHAEDTASSGLTLKAAKIQPVDDAWRAALPRDADAATDAYMARISPEARARSNAYFEGGYWIQLWNFLIGLAITWVLLSGQRAVRLKRMLDGKFKHGAPRLILFITAITLITWVLDLPFTIYTQYAREHTYGLLNQTFAPWFKEQLIGTGVGLVMNLILMSLIYWVIRKAPKSWELWGTAVTIIFMVFVIVLAPVFVSPLFNKYESLPQGKIRDDILALARSNGIPADDVFVFDASKQTDRVSANVSGFLGTTRISLNDNLLKRTTLPQIRAVMGHEMGHYALHHVRKMLVEFAILAWLGFVFVKWGMLKFGPRFGVRDPADLAGMPLLMALFSIYLFVLTPITNTLIREQEAEADLFGVNTSREGDGAAEVDLMLTEYRKPDPGPIEEFIFFDHPSPRRRIHMALQWKAENMKAPLVQEPPEPQR